MPRALNLVEKYIWFDGFSHPRSSDAFGGAAGPDAREDDRSGPSLHHPPLN